MKRLLSLLMVMFLLSCSDLATNAITDFEHLTPRPFGYVMGDEIEHRIIIETRDGVKLNKAALPTQGIINRWLNLNQIQVNESPLDDGFHYEIALRYQVFYAPQSVKMLTIPSVALAFNQDEKSLEKTIPAWQFTLSPLRDLQVKSEQGSEYMRPNAPVPLLSAPYAVTMLLFSTLGFLSSGVILAYFYGYISLPRRKIFKRANQQLAKLTENDTHKAFAIMHHALNTLNRKPLFSSQLSEFYEQHPQYQSANKLLDDFFQVSTAYFFAGRDVKTAETLQLIKKSCHICAAIERGQK
jgi:mxaA protein